MKGFPKHLNSKADYYYIKKNFPKKQWVRYWQDLLENRYADFNTGQKSYDKSELIEDDTHRIVEGEKETVKETVPTKVMITDEDGKEKEITEDKEVETEKQVYYQYEKRENPGSDFVRLRFTEEEVQSAIA